jgi:tetratricopeptide (TPR) repeat protein
MLDTIREYAVTRLADAGESSRLEHALRDYVLRTAERCLAIGMAQGPVPWADRVDCSRRYVVDEGNITQVLTWCLSYDDTEIGLRIGIAVSPRWLVWGLFAEGGEWLDAFLSHGPVAPAPRIRGAALVARAQLAVVSDPAAAETLAEEGLALCREEGEKYWTAVALNLLSETAWQTGRVALDLGAVEQARRHLTRSLKLSQATGTRIGVARGLEALATLAVREKQSERAVQVAAAAATLRESAGVPPLPPARTETYLASARHLGEPAVARLWAQGLALSSEAAVALAIDTRPKAADDRTRPLTVVGDE